MGIFRPPSPPPPPPPPPPPAPPPAPPPPPPPPATPEEDDSAELQAARDAERRRARLAQGRSASILTSGQGDTSAAPVRRKRLLGQ